MKSASTVVATVALVALILASAGAARAADRAESGDTPPSVDPTRACPTREAVAAALSPALARAGSDHDPLPGDFRLVDLGEAFEVTAGGQLQRYADVARDCAERARVAAVFVALAVNPPSIEPPRAQAPAITAGAVEQVQPAAARERTWLSVGLAARVDGALAADSDTTSGAALGGEIEVSLGRGALGVAAIAGVTASTESAVGSVQVDERRFPCSLSVTVRRRVATHLEARADLGVSLTPFTLHGRGLETTLPVTRFDAGGRLALELRVLAGALVPFANLHLEYFPRTYDIAVAPLGDVGATAPVQIGLSLGLAFDVRR